jgi:hypothetical protein
LEIKREELRVVKLKNDYLEQENAYLKSKHTEFLKKGSSASLEEITPAHVIFGTPSVDGPTQDDILSNELGKINKSYIT